MGIVIIIVGWVLCAVCAGWIAEKKKGRSHTTGILLGALLGILGIAIVLCLADRRRKCQFCMSRVPVGASVCPSCNREIGTLPTLRPVAVAVPPVEKTWPGHE